MFKFKLGSADPVSTPPQICVHSIKIANPAAAKPVFTCEDCGYSSIRRADVIVHRRTHTGERPYVCNAAGCGYSTARSSNLVRHARVHTGERPYRCKSEGCEYAAGDRSSFLVHQRIHEGLRPFRCDFVGCSYKALTQSKLTVHARVHLFAALSGGEKGRPDGAADADAGAGAL